MHPLRAARRLLATLGIASILAAGGAPHQESLLEGSHSFGAIHSERAITRHDPRAPESHWHAVLRFIKDAPCLACHWQRSAASPPPLAGSIPPPTLVHGEEVLDSPTWSCLFQSDNGSRAPPALL